MNKFLKLFFASILALSLNAQSVDKVEAIIGDEIILTSDIESQYLQYLSQGNFRSLEARCQLIEDILYQKLLINKAKLDSVVISDTDVEQEIEGRLDYFIVQLGSLEKVEGYFGKSRSEIEVELSQLIKDQFMAQKIQSSIATDVKATPSEVQVFYNNQNTSDIPLVPTKVEVIQIIIKPEIASEQKDKLKDKLNGFRKRVYAGEDFKVLATLYSDDPASASRGGELGFVKRGDLVPEFERTAFRLKEGEISEVVESQFGFHIIQLIKRRGDQINVRHILLKSKVSSTALYNAKLEIEEIEDEIRGGGITFEDAVIKYSDDESKSNGGLLLNPNTMSTMHTIDDMSPKLKRIVDNLSVNEVSNATVIDLPDDSQAYRILKISKRVEAHTANLADDFSMIKEIVVSIKKQDELHNWIQKTINETYIRINEDILGCTFNHKWIK
tara:strand:+ start:23116 stop:24441 length:1326 start_codon:yes stop_codon:yes gene_type:complete